MREKLLLSTRYEVWGFLPHAGNGNIISPHTFDEQYEVPATCIDVFTLESCCLEDCLASQQLQGYSFVE